jgi:hypothetical protein
LVTITLILIYCQMYGSGACEAAMTQQIYGESSGSTEYPLCLIEHQVGN